MWDNDENRLAVVELVHSGRLRRREGQFETWRWLSELSSTHSTRRRGEITLIDSRRADLERVLDRRWPEWREVRVRLLDAGLPITHEGWKKLQDQERASRSGSLPPRLNSKTAAAQVGPHSKARLTAARRSVLAGVELMRDGIVRLRPNTGLVLEAPGVRIDASLIAAVAGEVVLNERALEDGTRLTGAWPAASLLVENLGPYMDVAVPDDWMVVHVPGWNTVTVKPVLDQLDGTPILHFGDLDPDGVGIVNHLRASYPGLRWVIPDFWKECVPNRAQKEAWPANLDSRNLPELVRELVDAGLWLEQETITLDPRLTAALERVQRGA